MIRRQSWSSIIIMIMCMFIGMSLPLKVDAMAESEVSIATSSNAEREPPEEKEDDIENDKDVHISTSSNAIKIEELEDAEVVDGIERFEGVEDNVAVRVPAVIKMESYGTGAAFDIVVAGKLEDDSIINISSDTEFMLESVYKEPISGTVSQDKDMIGADDLEDGEAVINGEIMLEHGVSAGEWKGSFNISIWLDSPSLSTLEWEEMQKEDEEEIEIENDIDISTPSNAAPKEDTEESTENGEDNIESTEEDTEKNEDTENTEEDTEKNEDTENTEESTEDIDDSDSLEESTDSDNIDKIPDEQPKEPELGDTEEDGITDNEETNKSENDTTEKEEVSQENEIMEDESIC